MTVVAPAGAPRKRRTRESARRASQIQTRYAVPALEKGLDILELLAREAEGLSLNELARELGRTSSELFRMVVALARRGYIEQRNGELHADAQAFRACASSQAHQVAHRCCGADHARDRASG